MTPIVYTSCDIRRMLAISDRTLSRLVQRGELPKPLIRGRWLRSEIDAWLSARTRLNPPLDANVKKANC